MRESPRRLWPLYAAVLMLGIVHPQPARAYACQLAAPPEGVLVMRQRPDATAKIIARLAPFELVDLPWKARERGGWIQVKWRSGKKTIKGWIRRDQVSDECED